LNLAATVLLNRKNFCYILLDIYENKHFEKAENLRAIFIVLKPLSQKRFFILEMFGL